MQRSILTITALALASVLWAGAASADPRTPGIDKRERNQTARIYSGVRDGSLGPRETRRLVRGQARIHRAERRFRSDGVVGPRERARLHRGLNRQSRRIYRAKRN